MERQDQADYRLKVLKINADRAASTTINCDYKPQVHVYLETTLIVYSPKKISILDDSALDNIYQKNALTKKVIAITQKLVHSARTNKH